MISVCIATYNGASFIGAQLQSIVSQLHEGDEVVISDDDSTDGTLDQISRCPIPEGITLRVVHHPAPAGYVANFEHALRQAQGDVIFLSDQDDLWHADKVERMLEALSEADLVVSDADIIDAQGERIASSFLLERGAYDNWLGNLYKFGHLGCCMAFRRNVLQLALPFPKNHRLATHDNWLFLVAKTFFRARVLHESLISYRRHTSNASLGGIKRHTSLRFKLLYRFYLSWQLFLRGCRRSGGK